MLIEFHLSSLASIAVDNIFLAHLVHIILLIIKGLFSWVHQNKLSEILPQTKAQAYTSDSTGREEVENLCVISIAKRGGIMKKFFVELVLAMLLSSWNTGYAAMKFEGKTPETNLKEISIKRVTNDLQQNIELTFSYPSSEIITIEKNRQFDKRFSISCDPAKRAFYSWIEKTLIAESLPIMKIITPKNIFIVLWGTIDESGEDETGLWLFEVSDYSSSENGFSCYVEDWHKINGNASGGYSIYVTTYPARINEGPIEQRYNVQILPETNCSNSLTSRGEVSFVPDRPRSVPLP